MNEISISKVQVPVMVSRHLGTDSESGVTYEPSARLAHTAQFKHWQPENVATFDI